MVLAMSWDVIKAVAPYAILGGIACGAMYGSYEHGCRVTEAGYKARIAVSDAAHAKATAEQQGQYRALEKRSADAMAAIDQRHQEEMANREAISTRTINDLRSGAVSLRARFTACQSATSAAPTVGASAGQRDEAPSIQLRDDDAQFLVRFSDEADAVADQLRECQAVVIEDREQNPEDE